MEWRAIAWPELAMGAFLGALAAFVFAYFYRRRILRALAQRELSRTRALIAQGRTEEATARLRRMVREGVYSDDIPQLALRQLAELYRGSRARERIVRIQSLVTTFQSEWRRSPRGDLRERLTTIQRALDQLGEEE